MRNGDVIRIAALLAACGAALFVGGRMASGRGQPDQFDAARQHMIAEARIIARPGDVLFKSGGGFWGTLAANFSANKDGYGHVGMVALGAEGDLVVIHAGGDPVTRNGRVQESGFDQFLHASKATALYRPRLNDETSERALAYVAAAALRGVPFDAAFSLATEDELYCTELIWRALSAALGEDASPVKSEKGGHVYLAIDDLQNSPWLAPLWRASQEIAPAAD